MAGLLADLYSAIDSKKRQLRGLLDDPVETLKQGLLNFRDDQNATLNLLDNAYQVTPGSKTVLNTPEQIKGFQKQIADKGADMAFAATFIGPGAKTWDALSAKKAQDMAAQGVDPRKIWSETGTWKGPDGKWRQEIPDNTAKLNKSSMYEDGNQLNYLVATKHGKGVRFDDLSQFEQKEFVAKHGQPLKGGGKISDIFSHGQLYDNYAGLGDKSAAVAIRPGLPYNGSYSSKGIDMNATNEADLSKGLVHELQHAIQQRERWARGGSPSDVGDITSSYANTKSLFDDALRQSLSETDPIAKSNAQQARNFYGLELAKKKNLKGITDTEAYRRLAGEAEARATQARIPMDAAQRRATFPLDSYDVPVDQLIIRGLLD